MTPPVAEAAPLARTARALQATATRLYRRGKLALVDDRVGGRKRPVSPAVEPLAGITVRLPVERADAARLAAAVQHIRALAAESRVIVSDAWVADPEALGQMWPRAERQLCWIPRDLRQRLERRERIGAGRLHEPRTYRPERTPLMADLPPVNPDLIQSLATRLARYVEGSLADFFSQPTNVQLDSPLTVFNVSPLDEALRPIGTHLIEQFVWTQVRWRHVQGQEEPCLVVVDELWLTLLSAEGGEFLETVARKGPKYWLGLVTPSQAPYEVVSTLGLPDWRPGQPVAGALPRGARELETR